MGWNCLKDKKLNKNKNEVDIFEESFFNFLNEMLFMNAVKRMFPRDKNICFVFSFFCVYSSN